MTDLDALLAAVGPVDPRAAADARRRSDGLLKPPGSLGALEDLGARLAAIAGRCPPPVPSAPAVVVAAADHGVAGSGVTAWPASVTAAMVGTFCAGTATVNALARTVGARVAVLDVGVGGDVGDAPGLRHARVRAGTANLAEGPAMTRQEAAQALLAGAALAAELARDGADLLVTGDMGIGNTTAGACVVGALTGAPAGAVVGRGAGADDAALAHKTAVVAAALQRARLDPADPPAVEAGVGGPGSADPLGVLAEVGGLELAALAGVVLAGAAAGLPVVLDGLASDAAALVAVALAPEATGYLIAGHRSTEPGAVVALRALGLTALLDLGMRLGEGTGGLLAVPLVSAAARVLSEVGSLADLGP